MRGGHQRTADGVRPASRATPSHTVQVPPDGSPCRVDGGPRAGSLYTRAVPAAVELTGEHLAIDDVWDVAVGRRPVVLGARGRERAAAAREFLESEVGDHTYGVNT